MKRKNIHYLKARTQPFLLMTAGKRSLLRCFFDMPCYQHLQAKEEEEEEEQEQEQEQEQEEGRH